MKNFKLIFCLYLLSLTAYAQIKINAETFLGYESNINKAPETYMLNDEMMYADYLQQSSLYQDATLRLSFKEKWRDSELKLSATPKIRYYFSEADANKILVNARAKYMYKFSKKIKWESNTSYKLKDQKGQDLDEAELSVPLGYNITSLNTGVHTRLNENNRTYIKVSYDIKNFDDSKTRSVSYKRIGVSVKFKNSIEKRQNSDNYGFTAGFYNRSYDIDYHNSSKTADRTWQYLNAGVFYKLAITNQWSISPKLDFEKRIDATNSKYGYSQLKPAVETRFKVDNISAKLSASYAARNFDTLQASTSEEKNIANLKYGYTRFKGALNYKLNKKITLKSEGYLIKRKSNNTNVDTKSYRSYTNYYLGGGVRYSF